MLGLINTLVMGTLLLAVYYFFGFELAVMGGLALIYGKVVTSEMAKDLKWQNLKEKLPRRLL